MPPQPNPSLTYQLKPDQIPNTVPEHLSPEKKAAVTARIKTLLVQRQATLVAHYYTDPALQRLADETAGCVSDSLEMARFGRQSKATTLVVCGVRFMGETAKILNPKKRILMPDLNANCSLDIGCPVDDFTRLRNAHPDRTVVVYANTSAAIKAKADWMVTSGSAIDVVCHLAEQGKKILWAPDKYLGQYVQEKTGADMLLWQGSCIVHEEFKAKELYALKQQHPDAKVLAHPESPAAVLSLADVIGSTTALLAAAKRLAAKELIVATDKGIFHKMSQLAPDKTLIEAPTAGKSATCVSCAHCPWMAMNGLVKLERTLATLSNEIQVDPVLCNSAAQPIKRLLDFTKDKKKLAGDA